MKILSALGFNSERHGDWPFYDRFWHKVVCIDGKLSESPVFMRRKVDGKWQYRELDPDEMRRYREIDAW